MHRQNTLIKGIVAVLLLASACWLVFTPTKIVSQETSNPVIAEAHASAPTPEIKQETNVTSSGTSKQLPTTQHTPKGVTSPNPAPTPTNGGVYNGRHYSKDEVIQLIKDYSAQYRIDSATPLCIARMESGYNQFSKNKSSTASGVFQYLTSTWRGTDEGRAGLSVFDADANVRAAVKYMAVHRSTQPWVVRNSCPSIKFL